MSVVFKLTPEQERDRESLKASLQDPGSPEFHQWLTPEQYASRFGATPDVVARTHSWLASQGLEVHETSRLGSRVTFSGRVADIQSAFHAQMRRYEVGGEVHYAMATAPAIPVELADSVLAIHNTHDFFLHPTSHPVPVNTIPDYKSGTTVGIAPPDWAALYDVAPLYSTGIGGTAITGAGISIAIVGTAAVAQSDINAFRTKFSLPASTVTTTLVPNTGAADPANGAAIEAVLDLEWSGGIAQKASIQYVAVGASDQNVDDATYYAIEQNIAPILSESWGGCEADIPQSDQDILQVYGSAASLLGITYLASAGDSGAASCAGFGISGLYVNIPASYPEVTSVGGTEFPSGDITYGSTGYASAYSTSETVWNETYQTTTVAAGGGISGLFPRPAYQSGLTTCTPVGSLPTSVTASAMRQVPDISAAAAGYSPSPSNNPILIECTLVAAGQSEDCSATGGTPKVFGISGTSASSPALAGVVALVEQATGGGRLGSINPLLYALNKSVPTAFHDIKTGNNEVACTKGTDTGCPTSGGKYGYAATTGYDCATGLGSLDVYNLVNAWSTLAKTTIAIAPTPTSTSEGADVALAATVKVPTANATALAGNVTFTFQTYSSDGTPDLSWTLGEKAITGGTVNGGNAELSIALPVGSINPGAQYVDVVASYGGDATHLASTSAKVRVQVSPLSFCLSPPYVALAASGKQQYSIVGGMTPARYELDVDDTCATDSSGNTTGCSTLDENTGAFVAGTGQAGYVTIGVFDKYDVEALAYVKVGSPTGTPPWGTGTAPAACGAVVADGGAGSGVDAGTGSDSGTIGGGNGDSGTVGGDDDSGVVSGDDDDSGAGGGSDSGIIVGGDDDDSGAAGSEDGGAGGAGNQDAGFTGGSSSSGCSCTTAGHNDAPAGTFASLLIGVALISRRRKQKA